MNLMKLLFQMDGTPADDYLLHTIISAHRKVATEDNISAISFKASMRGGNTYAHAIASGILATGFRHAPIEQTRVRLFEWGNLKDSLLPIRQMIERGIVIPGFGHDVIKDMIDPVFQIPFAALKDETRNHLATIAAMISEKRGKPIYPNAASITAAVAHELALPPGGETVIFLIGRSTGWITL